MKQYPAIELIICGCVKLSFNMRLKQGFCPSSHYNECEMIEKLNK